MFHIHFDIENYIRFPFKKGMNFKRQKYIKSQ
jgi:hypothetical protein